MTNDQTPLPERVAQYYSELSAASKDLNSISDELGKPIAEIDVALKRLNLGVAVWVPIQKEDGVPDESWYWSEDIGYAKIGANWGICLRKVTGDYQRQDCDERVESWLFNDAPRTLRISAIEKIPDLIERLSKAALETTEAIRERLSVAQAVAEAVKGAANSTIRTSPRLPIRPTRTSVVQVEAALASESAVPNLESLREAVCAALDRAGHSSAAQVLGTGVWKLDGAMVRIETAAMGKKMLSLTVNAAAEKIIREVIVSEGGPARFLVAPGETGGTGQRAAAGSSTDGPKGVEEW